MFLKDYLDEFYYIKLIDNYDYNYLVSLDYNNFKKVYDVFVEHKFSYINDIILRYLEIFEYNPVYIEKCLNIFKDELGPDYVNIISKDMRYFSMIIDDYLDNEY